MGLSVFGRILRLSNGGSDGGRICAEAAVYFRPISPEDLAHQIRQLAADGSLQAKLGAAGRERAATHFRWEEHVRRLLARVGAPSPKVVASDRAAPKPLSCR
ncbi:MAG: hypothetical protein DMG26_18400 [Acidobacteria bacterium]|nr:MAG: hypothetical protein DMG26_18400 [Acidobacteriota bacterium]